MNNLFADLFIKVTKNINGKTTMLVNKIYIPVFVSFPDENKSSKPKL